ncbi:putative MPP superfamily phosphohydrolase [Clostridium pascui]|uniref:metallophosphoesterase n=1 Tax=Clostridium pascui TaxID=46609 RepID=UPI00195EF006|nr:metallophosphoesterase [Clostridium pascui]MBM7869666.1 putative MPP superfamily phosphohydrolase [Clostridium pascui]
MKLKSKRSRNHFIIFFIIIGLVIFFIWQNNDIVISTYEYRNLKVPKGFYNYKIVQISDLHNKNYHDKLSKKVKEINPDIIVITGDLIDRRNTRIDIAVEFVQQMVKIAPTYYVSGNHEQLSGEYDELKEKLEELNVINIDNSYAVLNQGGNSIGLMGIADPAIQQSEGTYLWGDNREYIKNGLEELFKNIDTNFNILLSHRPEQFSIYKEINVNLVFSGHAHGGQIRVPFIGGLVAPNQGLFPKYTGGVYNDGETSMVVSRGLGNSIFPLRVFNRPELVVVTLKK